MNNWPPGTGEKPALSCHPESASGGRRCEENPLQPTLCARRTASSSGARRLGQSPVNCTASYPGKVPHPFRTTPGSAAASCWAASSKHLRERRQHLRLRLLAHPPKAPDEPRLIHRAKLVQYHLPRFATKATRNTCWIRTALPCHWRHDDGRDVSIHLIGRDYQAWSRFLISLPTVGPSATRKTSKRLTTIPTPRDPSGWQPPRRAAYHRPAPPFGGMLQPSPLAGGEAW